MDPSLLDTDALSEVLKQKNELVALRASNYLAHFGTITFSAVTRYEVLRGLLSKSSPGRVERLTASAIERLCFLYRMRFLIEPHCFGPGQFNADSRAAMLI